MTTWKHNYTTPWFNPQNSSVQPWLEWDTHSVPSITPCVVPPHLGSSQGLIHDDTFRELPWIETSCVNVCNNSELLFSTQHFQPGNRNLANCGIWVTALLIASRKDKNNTFQNYADETYSKLTVDQFAAIGLDMTSWEFASFYADTISYQLRYVYGNLRKQSPPSEFVLISACDREHLFSNFDSNSDPSPASLCLSALCSPEYINEGLGGIGVSALLTSSFQCLIV